MVVVRLEQVHGKGGNERPGEDIGREHGEDDGLSERNEEDIARHR